MSRRAKTIVASLLLVIGAIWLLQGVGVLGGSVMTGSSFWAWVGAACILASVVLFVQRLRGGP